MSEATSECIVCVVLLLAMGAGTTSAGTASIASIGVLDPAHPESAVLAMTGSGQYAVGYSKGPNSNNTAVIRQPIFWSATTGILKLKNPALAGPGSEIDGEARGIVYRPLHPTKAFGIAGNIAALNNDDLEYPPITPVMQFCWGSLTNPAGGTWAIPDEANALNTTGAFNAARPQQASASSSEGWYVVGRRRLTTPGTCTDGSCNNRAYRLRVDPIGYADWYALFQDGEGECVTLRGDDCCPNIGYGVANSVDTYGQGIGHDDGNMNCSGQHRAIWFVGINTWGMVIPGGARILSEGFGISHDGQVVSGFDASAIEGSAPAASRAFIWRALPEELRDPQMRLLNNLAGDTLGCALAVTTYETAAGYSSDGTTERAVVWDTTGMWDLTGQPKLLVDLLVAQGVDMSAWTRLTRITSISDNAQTVAGWGVWAADGSTRGFIATSRNGIGACCKQGQLGTGICLSGVTSVVCASQGGTYLGDDSVCGAGNANCNFCGKPWADTNFDGDVDMDDFGLFQACFGILPVSAECGCLDKAAPTGKIDLDDFKEFLDCATGPNVPYVVDPACES